MTSKDYVSFEEVKSKVSFEQVCGLLGINLTPSGKGFRAICPFCEHPRTLGITPEVNLFHCFNCEASGDQIALYAKMKNMGMKEAAIALNGPVEAPKTEGMKELEYLIFDHPGVAVLGFDPEQAHKLGIGYASRGIMKGNIAVPIRLPNGKLTGYIGIQDAVLPKEFHL